MRAAHSLVSGNLRSSPPPTCSVLPQQAVALEGAPWGGRPSTPREQAREHWDIEALGRTAFLELLTLLFSSLLTSLPCALFSLLWGKGLVSLGLTQRGSEQRSW